MQKFCKEGGELGVRGARLTQGGEGGANARPPSIHPCTRLGNYRTLQQAVNSGVTVDHNVQSLSTIHPYLSYLAHWDQRVPVSGKCP